MRRELEALYLRELRAEWQRRREQCAADLEQARELGDLAEYRRLRQHWQRYYTPAAENGELPPRPSPTGPWRPERV